MGNGRFTLRTEQMPGAGGAHIQNVFHRDPAEIASNAGVGRKELAKLLVKKFGVPKATIAGISVGALAFIAFAGAASVWFCRRS